MSKLSKRAQSAAKWLMSNRPEWSINNVTADHPEAKECGRWMIVERLSPREQEIEYFTHQELIWLALREGWALIDRSTNRYCSVEKTYWCWRSLSADFSVDGQFIYVHGELYEKVKRQ